MAPVEMPIAPMFMNGTQYNADPIRRVLSGILGDSIGLFGAGDFVSTVNTDYTVTVQPGRAALPTPDPVYAGVFLAESNAAVTIPITPPHATADRIDRLIAYAVPPVDAQHAGHWYLEVRPGVPGKPPSAPNTAGSMLLREFRVYSEADGRGIESFDYRFSNGQQLFGGANLYGLDRPTSARFGTLWTNSTTGITEMFGPSGWIRVTPTPPVACQLVIPGGYPMNNQQTVNWQSATRDTAGMWGGATNPSRVIAREAGLYAYSASFNGGFVAGTTQIYRTISIVSRYTTAVGGTREIIGGLDGASWGAAPTGAWSFFGASGVVDMAAGQSLGITIETAVAGLTSPPSFVTRFGIWKIG